MVTITKDMKIADDPNLVIHSAAGDYSDTDLIMCADRANPSVPSAQLQAQYIKYGPVVYQFNTPEELGAALAVVDPESTHDAVLLYKEEEARKLARTKGTLEPSDPVPAPDSPEPTDIPEEEEDDVKFFKEQANKEEASSTPEVVEAPEEPELPTIEVEPVEETPTPSLPVDNTSTTTSALPEEAIDLSTTTPE